ncbi:MAG: type VI secretion system baseplate subunit TssK, partial [Chthoniobacterales bacterium]|nr:type VI secretion system baseplate subunit TssK [Chthoniobacterales bacterium]
TQLEQLLRLQALNRSLVTLRLLSNTQNLHPFSAFLALHQLASDLCSLQPDSPFPLPIPYNHDQPHLSFLQLSDLLRQLLRSSSQPSYIKIPFILAENFLKATLPLETPYQNAYFFLGIHTSDDPIEVARLVQNEDRFKLTPPSLANRAVRGILLQEERFPPYQLPIETSLLFFRLRISESQEIWARVEKENALTARWSGYEKGNLELALYIVPKKSS